jgi:MAP3K TRAFs-binding domain
MTTCFVAMGFAEKTAFYGGKKKQRLLNLDKTYEHIIKPAVLGAGFECVRADEILHSTVIDKPMYEQLLGADIVVADLSTSNANAIYELGVRHALRPWTTIVMAEEEFAFPFDVARLNILKYKHLGSDIGAGEAKRATAELQKRLVAIAAKKDVDSPVFLFLPELQRGALRPESDARHFTLRRIGDWSIERDVELGEADLRERRDDGRSIAELRAAIGDAVGKVGKPSDWLPVVDLLKQWSKRQPNEPYVIQQLALATYKSEHPDKVAALQEARKVLEALEPRVSSDGETAGLWGAIHKRLWEAGQSRADLDEAIRSHERGFYFKNDHYNGINLAFLLDVRAGLSAGEEAVADRVLAARTRREVLKVADEFLSDENAGEAPGLDEYRYWVRASRAEALFGLGRRDEAEAALAEAKRMTPAPRPWMIDTTERQLAKLEAMLPGK